MSATLPTWVNIPPLVPGKAPEDTTVVVAMSGGVDSSCVAALCHKLGYKTVGMTLQLWDYTPASNGGTTKQFGTCCALDDVYDARMVCQTLGIPHYVLNMESAFKEAVIDDFVETYLAGATPIPCVRCNQRIKFKELLDKAKTLGADVLVTGHYVRKDWIGSDEIPASAGMTSPRKAVLKRGDDPAKDQSYYLFTTTQEQLEFLEFPLGRLEKPKVRELAKLLGIHNHGKKDSYDICFVPGGDYRKVVRKFAPEAEAPGTIVDEQGKVLGTHDGIVGFTVGQRKGLPGGSAEPLYVIEIRPNAREVVVGPRSSLGRRIFTVKELNWLDGQPAERSIVVKVRAQHAGSTGVIHPLANGRAEVVLDEPEDQISPGQAAVFYTSDATMLGGGWIETGLPKGPVKVMIKAGEV